ncbi:hypothetical protein F53441_1851 [Fusarium austroafricanum]|uniref:Nitrogen regulatory protein areA GATA-like domain-containing protein n=1 Tax=Fusarium austroafricanum TaxID=2364996 RepID=A0A8H4KUG3_9HYPO|nr:hypothetical protein F53441_1851 [Fusarium austroafricanum]
MPYCLDIHVLTVNANVIHKVDTGNPANLYSMWTDSVEQGPRLENLSWRLWQRETFVVDDEEKTIVSIVEDKGPLSAPPHVTPVAEDSSPVPPVDERSGSPTTESQSPAESITASRGSPQPSPQSLPRTTVVRGLPKSLSLGLFLALLKHQTRFPSPSRRLLQSEQDQSLSNSKPTSKEPVLQIGDSFEEDGSLKSTMALSQPSSSLSDRKKQVSFSNNVMAPTVDDEAAVDSDTDDYIDESAIDDDDDSSDWEDSMDESGKSSMDDKFFQRVDSKLNLASRRSLITLMLAQNDRTRNLGNHASQSTSAIPRSRLANGPSLGASPNDSDEAPLMMKGMRGPGLKPIHEVPRSSSQPIMTGPQHIQPQAALSPRTTRRNMLATELTESLRRHLLWERQQKSSTANAVLKRRHTSHDVANLRQYPEKPCMKKSEDVTASSWDQYFSKEASDGYHSKGW